MKIDTKNVFGPLKADKIYEYCFDGYGLCSVTQKDAPKSDNYFIPHGKFDATQGLYVTGSSPNDIVVFPIKKPSNV